MNAATVSKKLSTSDYSDVDAYRGRAMKRLARAIVTLQSGLAQQRQDGDADWANRGPAIARDLAHVLFELEYMGEELLRTAHAEPRKPNETQSASETRQ